MQMLQQIYPVFEGFVIIVLSWVGIDYSSLKDDDQKRILAAFAAIVSMVPFIIPILFSRMRIIRRMLHRETGVEGFWIERVARGDRNFVTLLQIGRRFLTNKPYVYGETLEFPSGDFRSPAKYAKFKSNSLHFEIEDDVVLTFNYKSDIVHMDANSIGLAQYEFPKFAARHATGWFIGVVDGSGELKMKAALDKITLHKISWWDWLALAQKNGQVISSFNHWKIYLAKHEYDCMKRMNPATSLTTQQGQIQ